MTEDEKEWLEMDQEVLVELRVTLEEMKLIKRAARLKEMTVEEYLEDFFKSFAEGKK